MSTVGTHLHAIREAIGRPFKALVHEQGKMLLKGAHAAGAAVRKHILGLNVDIDKAAEEFQKELHAEMDKLLKQHFPEHYPEEH